MEYKIKIELQDETGKVLARTTMTEEHANAIRRMHGVDVLLDAVETMKKGIEDVTQMVKEFPHDKTSPEMVTIIADVMKLHDCSEEEALRKLGFGWGEKAAIPEGIMQKANVRNSGHIYPVGGPDGYQDLVQDAMGSLELSLEKNEGATIGTLDSPTVSFLQNMQEVIDKRRGETQEDFWPWVEDGIPVTKEDIQDYVTYFGVSSETAYECIKKYATGETKEIEVAGTAKDITEKRTPLTPEQISKLFNAIGPAPADHPWNGGNVLP